MAAQGLSSLAHDAGADAGRTCATADRLPGDLVLLRRRRAERRRTEEPRRGRPEAARDLRKARHSAARARAASRRRRRRRVRQRLRRDDVQGQARRGRRHLLLVLRGRSERIPIWCSSYLGTVVPYQRQFLRDAELGRVHGRLLRLRAEGRALPDGAVDLLSHQRREDRAVRAHADRRRRG